ncbi:MAG: sulfite exporter TauE/SafE family protein [Verrucomicrobiales bacterium]|nr:sulfite exporter TauE/SafE family protein [Verrucomicrobiales bacterium]
MSGIGSINGTTGAFVAGLVTSVHCAGMCGLLTCGLGIASGNDRIGGVSAYHASRLFAYMMLGVLTGAIGYYPVSKWMGGGANLVPWVLIIFLVLVGLGAERFLPTVPWLDRLIERFRHRLTKGSRAKRGMMMGFATPLLPCGPLYAMLGIGLLSGSPVKGAELMLAFGMGTVPLLWLMQSGAGFWQKKISAKRMQQMQRGLALVAALALTWRFRGTLWFVDQVSACGCDFPHS